MTARFKKKPIAMTQTIGILKEPISIGLRLGINGNSTIKVATSKIINED
jgi:hypothetical protein